MNTENIVRSKCFELLGVVVGLTGKQVKYAFNNYRLNIFEEKDVKKFLSKHGINNNPLGDSQSQEKTTAKKGRFTDK